MLFINYKGNTPQQRFYTLGVQGNNKSNKIKFVVTRQQADIDLSGYACNLKVESKDNKYKDLILLNGVYKEDTKTLEFIWEMPLKSTQYRNLELQLEFLGEEEIVWQTMIVELELSETIKVGDEKPSDKELSVLKQLEIKVQQDDNRITQNSEDIEELQQEMEDKDNIIIGNPDDYLNEQGLKKIVRVEENENVKKSYFIDKTHYENTLVVCEPSREENGYEYQPQSFFEDLGSANMRMILGNFGTDEFGYIYSLYYNQNGVITKGMTFGLSDFSEYGLINFIDCKPNTKVILVVGKYFEYDENGNKVFDEHSALFSTYFSPEQQGVIGKTIEITEERQEVILQTNEDGMLYFDSDGTELHFMNTRFILYEIRNDGEPAHDEYAKREIDGSKTYIETTYSELKQLRDNSQLVRGCFYRITDYTATTIQNYTKSAGHQFDIVVQALSENTLSEKASAVLHNGDTYFADCDLSSWELKYCLDNDTTRFYWALNQQAIVNLPSAFSNGRPLIRQSEFDGEGSDEYQYAWGVKDDVDEGDSTNFVYSKNPTLTNGEVVWSAYGQAFLTAEVISEGKGVIYYMKDEWNNECPYDFKNIMFKRWAITSYKDILSLEIEYDDFHIHFGAKTLQGTWVIDIASYNEDNYVWAYTFSLKDLSTFEIYDYTIVAHIGLHNDEGTLMACSSNKIENANGDEMATGSMGILVLNNNVFWGVYSNIASPSFAEDYSWCNNNILESNCYDNTFGINCDYNKFASSCSGNTCGHVFRNNELSVGCYNNKFGSNCYRNTFKSQCRGNILPDSCQNNNFGQDNQNNTFGSDCQFNTFGSHCYNNKFGNDCSSITFGNDCSSIFFGTISSVLSRCRNIIIENNCFQLDILGAGSIVQFLQNIHIHLGVKGEPNRKTITIDRGLNYETSVVATGSETIEV